MKKCSKCNKTKDLNSFGKNKKAKDNLNYYCKECINNYYKSTDKKEYLKRNKFKIKKYNIEYSKIYYARNKNKIINKTVRYLKRDMGLYRTFCGMRARCNSKSDGGYKYYGGKGIKCEWKTYQEFKNDMYDSFIKHLNKYGRKQTSIDRIDSDKNYCKENCRWATWKEQTKNKVDKYYRLKATCVV